MIGHIWTKEINQNFKEKDIEEDTDIIPEVLKPEIFKSIFGFNGQADVINNICDWESILKDFEPNEMSSTLKNVVDDYRLEFCKEVSIYQCIVTN